MKGIITFAAVSMLMIGCERSAVVDYGNGGNTNAEGSPAKAVKIDLPIKGTWDLVAFYVDNGTGTGSWVAADFTETIYFGEYDKFRCTETFPLYSYQYSRYVTENDGFVIFFPGVQSGDGAGDSYRYLLESPTQLVFYPQCRENCARRYQLRNGETE
jgi:hypothetical protein